MLIRPFSFMRASTAGAVQPTVGSVQTPIIDPNNASSNTGTVFGVTAGRLLLVAAHWRRSSSASPSFTVTLGGAAVSEIAGLTTTLSQFHPCLWVGQITPAGGGDLTLSFGVGSSGYSGLVVSVVEVLNAGSLGTPTEGTSTNTSYTEGYVTTVDNALVLGWISVDTGTGGAFTPDATAPTVEKVDQAAGAGSNDVNAFVGSIETNAAAGTFTWGASWVSSREFVRGAVEVQPA